MLLEGTSIVVTGGNTGIGKAIVLAAAAEGANVVVDYIMHPEYTAEVIAAAERTGGCAVGVEADVSRTDDLHLIIQTAVEQFGRLDILISNAGIETRTSLLETSEADFDKVLAVNLKSAFFGARFAAQQLVTPTQRRADLDDLLHPRRLADARQHRLLRLQGRREDAHPHGGRRAGIAWNPVRQHRAGGGEHPDQRRHRDGSGTAQTAGRNDPARPDRPARRDRRRRGVPGIRQGRVRQATTVTVDGGLSQWSTNL